MATHFGTDGIRGKANDNLRVETAFAVGRYLGYVYSKEKKGKILIGMDTRLSSSMFEAAVAAGASSSGADVYCLRVCPTPAVAYLTGLDDFDCGVMISASHNPYYDNGIKVFNHQGVKISNELEHEIEHFIEGKISIQYAQEGKIGCVIDYREGLGRYKDYLKSLFTMDLSKMTLALDTANGSATTCAYDVLTSFGAKCHVIHNQPDGVNINAHCGSTHPESLQSFVKEIKADLGLAFDGDADRLIAVDENGKLVDGDHVLYACGVHMKQQGLLKHNTLVTTVMANLGCYKALDRAGIDYKQTAVGDKNVYECMVQNDYQLGGEQSGHIIFKHHATTGDGLLTALKILEVMSAKDTKVSALFEDLYIYPQLLKNVRVNDKSKALHDTELIALTRRIQEELGSEGRILVRPSGTEPLVRVMVEAKSDELCARYVDECVDFLNQRGL
jgi:phosphoglucosamine mutase